MIKKKKNTSGLSNPKEWGHYNLVFILMDKMAILRQFVIINENIIKYHLQFLNMLSQITDIYFWKF